MLGEYSALVADVSYSVLGTVSCSMLLTGMRPTQFT